MVGIDHKFIDEREGGIVTEGYVPHASGSQSGVTVGAGVDLGQIGLEDLRAWGCAGDLIERLEPYLGKKRTAAQAALDAAPLIVTVEEAEFLSAAARKSITEALVRFYDRDAPVNFSDLPDAAQTVIASVAYQYGPRLAARCPSFWRHACRRDWIGMEAELRDFNDDYDTRRTIEADYLRDRLQA